MSKNILAFDTSAAHCAVGLLWDGRIVFDETRPMSKGQAEALVPMIEEALADREKSDIEAIAVGIGPGNFTGTRIAVATARGLALSLGIPAIGISNFELLYAPGDAPDGPHDRALPAPRDSAYIQAFNGLDPVGLPRHDPAVTASAAPQSVPTRLIAYAQIKDINARPAPLYMRPPDAALPSEPPVTILS